MGFSPDNELNGIAFQGIGRGSQIGDVQAHMSREAREVSGLSPGEILRRLEEDETYWIYRIWT